MINISNIATLVNVEAITFTMMGIAGIMNITDFLAIEASIV